MFHAESVSTLAWSCVLYSISRESISLTSDSFILPTAVLGPFAQTWPFPRVAVV